VVTQYQTTRHVEEALARLTEAYMAIGIVGEAQTAAAVLGHNFPDSSWYKDAYKLVKAGGLETEREPGLLYFTGLQEAGPRLTSGAGTGQIHAAPSQAGLESGTHRRFAA